VKVDRLGLAALGAVGIAGAVLTAGSGVGRRQPPPVLAPLDAGDRATLDSEAAGDLSLGESGSPEKPPHLVNVSLSQLVHRLPLALHRATSLDHFASVVCPVPTLPVGLVVASGGVACVTNDLVGVQRANEALERPALEVDIPPSIGADGVALTIDLAMPYMAAVLSWIHTVDERLVENVDWRQLLRKRLDKAIALETRVVSSAVAQGRVRFIAVLDSAKSCVIETSSPWRTSERVPVPLLPPSVKLTMRMCSDRVMTACDATRLSDRAVVLPCIAVLLPSAVMQIAQLATLYSYWTIAVVKMAYRVVHNGLPQIVRSCLGSVCALAEAFLLAKASPSSGGSCGF
jgi:hypothetical protein